MALAEEHTQVVFRTIIMIAMQRVSVSEKVMRKMHQRFV